MTGFRNLIELLKKLFRIKPKNITTSSFVNQQQEANFSNLPPGFIPKETVFDTSRIPGTSLDVGLQARVLQSLDEELITCEQRIGIRCGCGHLVYVIDEIRTENFTQPGVAGVCHECSKEAEENRKKGLITIQEAQAKSLYCTQCASHCDECGRRNLCVSHTHLFEDTDGKRMLLCPDCLKKAEAEKFFKKTLSILISPFIDEKQKQKSNHFRDYYES